MSGKLNTKDIKTGGGGVPKLLQPGNQSCKINSVKLEEFKFREGGYHLVLQLEGKDMGSDFEGFFIDKNDESQGRYKGQIGQVKASEWAFADGTTKSGIEVSRDAEILKFMKNLCISLGILQWLTDQDGKHDTIESIIETFNKEKPFKDKFIEWCIAGKEYLNNKGYTNFELFLPKYSKAGAPFGDKVVKFNPADHIKKKKVEEVEKFGDDTPDTTIPSSNSDFDLEN